MLLPVPPARPSGASYASSVLASGPRAYWKMQDASGFPVDSSGNGLDCTSGVATSYQQPGVPAIGDYSIKCAGGQGFFRSSVVSAVTDNWTLEMWVKAELILADNQTLFYNGNSGANGWGLLIKSAGNLVGLAGGVSLLTAGSGVLSSTEFTHVACVRRATVWEYYINGVVDTANAGTASPGVPSGTVSLGGSANFQWSGEHYALYETALSAATIKAHYEARIGSLSAGSVRPVGVRRTAVW